MSFALEFLRFLSARKRKAARSLRLFIRCFELAICEVALAMWRPLQLGLSKEQQAGTHTVPTGLCVG
jgi:hypothetical protein